MHAIAAKAVAFGEALQPEFKTYAKQVIKNAKSMAGDFASRGYGVISGGTDNHLMLIDLRSKGITGKEAEEALGRAEITVNKNMVPFDTQSPFVTSGIRLGTPAMTTRGFGEAEFGTVVSLMDRVLSDPGNEKVSSTVRQEVKALCDRFPLYDFTIA